MKAVNRTVEILTIVACLSYANRASAESGTAQPWSRGRVYGAVHGGLVVYNARTELGHTEEVQANLVPSPYGVSAGYEHLTLGRHGSILAFGRLEGWRDDYSEGAEDLRLRFDLGVAPVLSVPLEKTSKRMRLYLYAPVGLALPFIFPGPPPPGGRRIVSQGVRHTLRRHGRLFSAHEPPQEAQRVRRGGPGPPSDVFRAPSRDHVRPLPLKERPMRVRRLCADCFDWV